LGTVLCVEELGRVSSSYCMLPTPQTVGPGLTILRHGTEEQKDKYVRGLSVATSLVVLALQNLTLVPM